MKTSFVIIITVAIRFRDVQYNKASPFYSYLLKDIYFSKLKSFRHPADARNKDKVALLNHLSSSSVPLSKNNDAFQGLPVPPQLIKRVRALSGSIRHWILAYHDFEEPDLFVLFPADQNHLSVAKIRG